jgi:tagaturonate reductase
MELLKENINIATTLKVEPVVKLQKRIIQFGTGVLLRGLVDYVVQKANNQQVFNGTIVQIKSTAKGDTSEFTNQDNRFHIAVRGVENGTLKQYYLLNKSIVETLNASTQWRQILNLAKVESLDIIVSNTTEVGILLDENDRLTNTPPNSFPAKLLALLQARYIAFDGANDKGYTIIPTELITNNGAILKEIVLQLATLNNCEIAFINWIKTANTFCNSLVDRIVAGKPTPEKLQQHWEQLKVKDNLLIECEPYLLWAIQGNEAVKQKLSFALPNSNVIIENNIDKYKELKLRLLNGTHSFLCAMAFLNKYTLVKDAFVNEDFKAFATELMHKEIAPTLPYATDEVTNYCNAVLDRFSNPFIDHLWYNISLNYTQKMIARNIETIQRYYLVHNKPPLLMAKCFAWYLKFIIPQNLQSNTNYEGVFNGKTYIVNDPSAESIYSITTGVLLENVVVKIMTTKLLWGGFDFYTLPHFLQAVQQEFALIHNETK